MNIYDYVVIGIVVLAAVCRLLKVKKEIFCFIVAVALILLLGLRDYRYMGIDLIRYYRHYTSMQNISFRELFTGGTAEYPLYYAINWLFVHWNISYQTFLFCLSVLSVGTTMWFICKYTEAPLVGIFIYLGMGLFTFQFSGLKQTMSMAFSLICIDRNYQKKTKQMLLWFLAAIMSHPEAIVLAPFLFLSRINFSKQFLAILVFVMGVVFVFRRQVGLVIMTVFEDGYIGKYESTGTLGSTSIFLLGVTALFFYGYYAELKNSLLENRYIQCEEGDLLPSIAYGLIMIVSIQLCSSFAYAFTRLNLFFIPIIAVAVSMGCESPKIKRRFRPEGVIETITSAAVCLLMYRLFFNHLSTEFLIPYIPFWGSR